MSFTDQNISDFMASLTSLSIDEENPAIKILKYQFNHIELLLEEQILNKNVYTQIAMMTKKQQSFFGAFNIAAKLFKNIIR